MIKAKSTQKQRFPGLSKFTKPTLWLVSLLITAFVTSAITWFVTKSLTENSQTKIYDYVFSSKDHTQANYGNADCWVSGMGNRSDAYKCSEGNLIYVPCFRDMADMINKVKCPRNPYDESETKYFNAKFTEEIEPLMSRYGETPTPWFILLSSGERCGFLYGATSTVANRRMDFGCKDGETLYLPTSERNGVYTISCLRSNKLEECKIKEMWR
jgi:hypothetical protein